MAIGNCKREQKVSLLQALTGLFTRVYMYEHRTKDARHKFKPVGRRENRPPFERREILLLFPFMSQTLVGLFIGLRYSKSSTVRSTSLLLSNRRLSTSCKLFLQNLVGFKMGWGGSSHASTKQSPFPERC
jgi:hypothetical protein